MRVIDAAPPPAIIVTAQRRAEPLAEVPLSVATLSRAAMDARGIRGIEDLARLIPNLRFGRTAGVAGNNGTNIAIRGIASDVGAATTAIYIDDTPIQIRNVGYFGGNPYPRIFDLVSVEVLRGPQGTLFGASAQGGAVRFLTPQPDFVTPFTLYARGEASVTRYGSPSGEGGIAIGGAVSPTLAVRASGWLRQDGGTIDRTTPDGARRLDRDIDARRTTAAKLALGWRPAPGVTLTPSLYYQAVSIGGRPQAWEGRPRATTGIVNREPAQDRFVLPALRGEAELGFASLIANVSLFRRSLSQSLDYATYLATLRSGNPFGAYANRDAANAVAAQTLRQRNAVQEVRLVSPDANAPIAWTAGLYHARARQLFTNLSGSGRIPGAISGGFPQYLGRYNLFDDVAARDDQRAAFASVDATPLAGLRLTAALRYTRARFDYRQTRDGPTNGGLRTTVSAGQRDRALTPRFAAAWQAGGTLLYVSAAKGFRQGGAQGPVDPGFCGADLRTLGLAASPLAYRSDSLWSYEAGAKATLAGGRLFVDANVYRSDWRNIQQSVRLPRCGFAYIANLGDARGHGTDITVSATPLPGLSLGGSLGYDETRFRGDVFGGNGLLIRGKGDRIGGPRLTASAWGEARHRAAYLRADYGFAGRGVPQNPAAFGYDPGLPPLGATGTLSTRLGVRRGGIDLSLFADNVTDARDPLARAHDAAGSPLYFVETARPRTIGLTAVARY